MHRYLAVSDIPAGTTPEDFRLSLQRIAEVAHDLGVRPIETIFSLDEGRAFSLFASDSDRPIREAHAEAALPDPMVFEVDRVFTELLDIPRRERFS